MIGRKTLQLVSMPIFHLDINARVILVDAVVRGPARDHAVRMILDTGSSYTLLAPEILLDIGCDLYKSVRRGPISTASGLEYTTFVSVPSIEALSQRVKSLDICVHSPPPTIPARGLLGLNFLRHFNIHLNFLDGNIEIIPKTS